MRRNYSIIDCDGRLLSHLAIKPVTGGHELDVSFERDFRRSLSVKKLQQARDMHSSLSQVFPNNQFIVVQITRQRGQYVVDLPDGDQPGWISKAVASLGGTLIA